MWPFNNRKNTSNVPLMPEEVQQYYKAENREKRGLAWLLALGTLIGTLVLAVGLFFGGRWVYQTVIDRDEPSQVQEESDTANENDQNDADTQPESAEGEDVPNDDDQAGQQPDPQTAGNNAQPNTLGESTQTNTLPSTGPEGTELY